MNLKLRQPGYLFFFKVKPAIYIFFFTVIGLVLNDDYSYIRIRLGFLIS